MKVINMNTAQIEKLINLVGSYPQLYDANNIEYADQQKRELIWEAIGRELNLLPELCRAKWTILRSGYRKALRSSRVYNRKKWRFEDNMKFLKNCIQSKRTRRIYEDHSDSLQSNNVSEDEDEAIDIKSEFEETKLQECHEEEASSCDSVPIADLLRNFEQNHSKKGEEALTQFFMSMAETVKTFPPLMQAKIKSDVFSCVNAAEIKYLQSQEKI